MDCVAPLPDAAHVQAFCASVVPGGESYLVECMPLLHEPFDQCFAIVPKQVVAQGGSQLTGWAIWEVPGLYIEAEFHAVWQRPDAEVRGVMIKSGGTRPEDLSLEEDLNNVKRGIKSTQREMKKIDAAKTKKAKR